MFWVLATRRRYGWIPGKAEVPEELREKYAWVDGTSMTFMETLHGVLRLVWAPVLHFGVCFAVHIMSEIEALVNKRYPF